MRWRSTFASVNKTPLWTCLFRTIDRVGSPRGMDEAQSRLWRNSAMMESPRNAHAPKRRHRFRIAYSTLERCCWILPLGAKAMRCIGRESAHAPTKRVATITTVKNTSVTGLFPELSPALHLQHAIPPGKWCAFTGHSPWRKVHLFAKRDCIIYRLLSPRTRVRVSLDQRSRSRSY
jgi:hypothetical protein